MKTVVTIPAILMAFVVQCIASTPVELQPQETIADIYNLESLLVDAQYTYLPVAPPSEEVFIQEFSGVLPVDWSGFPKKITKQMYAQMDTNGFPIYRISIYEDPVSRDTVFLNSYGIEVYRLAPEKDYDPYAWQIVHFNLESTFLADLFYRWIYDPAHIAVRCSLIPEIFHEDYLLAEKQLSSVTATPETMALTLVEELEGWSIQSETVKESSRTPTIAVM